MLFHFPTFFPFCNFAMYRAIFVYGCVISKMLPLTLWFFSLLIAQSHLAHSLGVAFKHIYGNTSNNTRIYIDIYICTEYSPISWNLTTNPQLTQSHTSFTNRAFYEDKHTAPLTESFAHTNHNILTHLVQFQIFKVICKYRKIMVLIKQKQNKLQ